MSAFDLGFQHVSFQNFSVSIFDLLISAFRISDFDLAAFPISDSTMQLSVIICTHTQGKS
jgi:hypothetical protein